jgi:hypothetical protein
LLHLVSGAGKQSEQMLQAGVIAIVGVVLTAPERQVNEILGFFRWAKNARSEFGPCAAGLSALKSRSVHKVIHNLCG